MRAWKLLLIAGASLAGCASNPPHDPWAGISLPDGPIAKPVDCGPFPYPTELLDTDADGAIDTYRYDRAGANELEAWRTCSGANFTIAAEHADQLDYLRVGAAELVQMGQHQRRIADLRLEMLEDERRHNFWASIGYWVVIGALGAAAAN